ncbi:MAG: glycyl-radical enzyme activating protein [Desulfovibrio sp.]|jgi:pyruvate formate lyase activating enzyme|nr:glycyl-radical enzyme activating protein [Desulfovibrio sp.]
MASFEDRKTNGVIFNVQKYSVHDGPGIRTIVFLKGCPLSCLWCSNPESRSAKPQPAYNKGRCLGLDKCRRCLDICPKSAVSPGPDKSVFIDRNVCKFCETQVCASVCPSQGIITYGQTKNVAEIIESVEQDSVFYSRSGGGMTLSGGEPLAQPSFALALLREAGKRRIRTALETCGHVPWEILNEAAGLLSSILYDVKHMDSAKHKEGTGVGNESILENLNKLLCKFPNLPVLVRTPVIPGFNDSEENAKALGAFLARHANAGFEALPYHRLGTQKYAFLGLDYPLGDISLGQGAAETFQHIVDRTRA